MGFAGFIIRLVVYAAVLGVASRIAEWLWQSRALDTVPELAPQHDGAISVMLLAPIVLAIVGIGPLRPLAILAAGFLAGAALTAPFVLARAVGLG